MLFAFPEVLGRVAEIGPGGLFGGVYDLAGFIEEEVVIFRKVQYA